MLRRRLTIDAIRDLRSGFLDPLRQSLLVAERKLLDQWPAVQEWVEGVGVPGRFAPAPNVVVLTDIEDYPAEFDRLMSATTGQARTAALATPSPPYSPSTMTRSRVCSLVGRGLVRSSP